jgi:hypothetical protein
MTNPADQSAGTPTPEGTPRDDDGNEEIRAHFASEPLNILIAQDGTRVEDRGLHRVCGQDCIDLFARAPEFNCFDDGCEYECCGCGRCCAPAQCSATGKGYVCHS